MQGGFFQTVWNLCSVHIEKWNIETLKMKTAKNATQKLSLMFLCLVSKIYLDEYKTIFVCIFLMPPVPGKDIGEGYIYIRDIMTMKPLAGDRNPTRAVASSASSLPLSCQVHHQHHPTTPPHHHPPPDHHHRCPPPPHHHHHSGWTFPPGTVIANLASSLQTGGC